MPAVFVGVERRIADRGGDPLLNLAVLGAPGLVPGLAAVAGGVASPAGPAGLPGGGGAAVRGRGRLGAGWLQQRIQFAQRR